MAAPSYELKRDAAAIEAILLATDEAQLVATFRRLVVAGDLTGEEYQRIRDAVAKRSHINKRTIDQSIKGSLLEQANREAQEKAQQRAAERRDRRPGIRVPAADAPWIEQMNIVNEVTEQGTSRGTADARFRGRTRAAQDALIPAHAPAIDRYQQPRQGSMMETSYLPAPEQLSIVKMSEEEVAEDIEAHIDYQDETGRSVHLPTQFVRHYMKRDDGALPTVVAIAQLPIVLADGHILAMRGLDRDRGIIFRIPEELMKYLPKREDCTPTAVAHAMQFLTDEWLCDVARTTRANAS